MAVPKKVYWALKTIQGYCYKHPDCDHCSLASFCHENMQKEIPCDWDLSTILDNKEQKDA